jgi:hypothetical protein
MIWSHRGGVSLPCPALPCPALPCPALPCPALPSPQLPVTMNSREGDEREARRGRVPDQRPLHPGQETVRRASAQLIVQTVVALVSQRRGGVRSGQVRSAARGPASALSKVIIKKMEHREDATRLRDHSRARARAERGQC